jgi:hypothetical protein
MVCMGEFPTMAFFSFNKTTEAVIITELENGKGWER